MRKSTETVPDPTVDRAGSAGDERATTVLPVPDAPPTDEERRDAATELINSTGATIKRTARRYSLCAADAEDAYQRALEILLTKAPTTDPNALVRWMHTVTKHEALAVRRHRERQVSSPPPSASGDPTDPIDLLPASSAGPLDRAERKERVARSSEALHALKPQELKALVLKAEGYSYAEIQDLTGWTHTKVNRCMAEGRKRFLEVYASIEEGRRCDELSAELSAYCDGEAKEQSIQRVQRHLRGCAHCRAKVREYRTLPSRVLALAPVALPLTRGWLSRLHGWIAGHGKLAEASDGLASASQLSANTPRGGGALMTAKVLAVCAGTAGVGAAGVATGVMPDPIRDRLPFIREHKPVDRETLLRRSQASRTYESEALQQEFAPQGSPVSGGHSSSGSAVDSGGSGEFGP